MPILLDLPAFVRRFSLLLLAGGALILSAFPPTALASTIVNLDATSTNPVSVGEALAAGTYTISIVGTSTPGALYNGWNTSAGAATNHLWTDRYGIQFGSGDQLVLVAAGNPGYSTAGAALGAYTAATTLQVYDATTQAPTNFYPNPFSFTLASAETVTLSIPDWGSYSDDTGGESLQISQISGTQSSTTPEPGSFALLGSGLVAVGLLFRKKTPHRKPVAARPAANIEAIY